MAKSKERRRWRIDVPYYMKALSFASLTFKPQRLKEGAVSQKRKSASSFGSLATNNSFCYVLVANLCHHKGEISGMK